MTFYTCRKCSQKFTYCSGLTNLLLCTNCVWEEMQAINRAERERTKAILEHEKSLYGEDVCLAYSYTNIEGLLSAGFQREAVSSFSVKGTVDVYHA